MQHPVLTFNLPSVIPTPKFGLRVGQITLARHDSNDAAADHTAAGKESAATRTNDNSNNNNNYAVITIDTPNIVVGAVRGVVPHLSRDHTSGSDAIRWINVPFESFLEQAPPIPTRSLLQEDYYRGDDQRHAPIQSRSRRQQLHRFLGFDPDRHVASLCLRDPLDLREMPPNGSTHVSANCVRGVKKVTLFDWRDYVYKTRPDVVFALTDTPFTPPPYSQKRITKSVERSASWLADILRPLPDVGVDDNDDRNTDASTTQSHQRLSRHPLNVFVHMAGGTSLPAREAFAHALTETLYGPEAEAVRPLRCLDEGVAGYAFDLAHLRGIRPSSQNHALLDGFLQWEESPERLLQHPELITEAPTPTLIPSTATAMTTNVATVPAESGSQPDIVSLLKASLSRVSERKPRIVTGVRSPHEMLRLIRDIGIDLFDVGWVTHAANIGVALDFVFPVQTRKNGWDLERAQLDKDTEGEMGMDTQRSLGHNLYDAVYTHQFGRLAESFVGAGESTSDVTAQQRKICSCIACSPCAPSSHILHSALDEQSYETTGDKGETRGIRYGKPHSRAYLHHLLHTHEMSAHTLLMAHNLAVVSAFLAGIRGVWAEDGNAGFASEVERFISVYDESGELFVAAKKDWESVDRARGKGRLAREREKQRNGSESEENLRSNNDSLMI